jgi:hypothetical protein
MFKVYGKKCGENRHANMHDATEQIAHSRLYTFFGLIVLMAAPHRRNDRPSLLVAFMPRTAI